MNCLLRLFLNHCGCKEKSRSPVLALIACFILLSFGAPIEARAEIGPKALDKTRNDTAQVKERLQGEAEKWSDEKQAVLEEIEYLKLRLDWLENRIGKYRSTLEKNEGFFHELEQERKESENLKLSLEPYLDEGLHGWGIS